MSLSLSLSPEFLYTCVTLHWSVIATLADTPSAHLRLPPCYAVKDLLSRALRENASGPLPDIYSSLCLIINEDDGHVVRYVTQRHLVSEHYGRVSASLSHPHWSR